MQADDNKSTELKSTPEQARRQAELKRELNDMRRAEGDPAGLPGSQEYQAQEQQYSSEGLSSTAGYGRDRFDEGTARELESKRHADRRPLDDMSEDPDALESDIEQTRARIDRTVASLERKMSPGQIMDEALSFVGGRNGLGSGPEALMSRLSANPLAFAMVAAGAVWLMKTKPETRWGAMSARGEHIDYPYGRGPTGDGRVGRTRSDVRTDARDMSVLEGKTGPSMLSRAGHAISDAAQSAKDKVSGAADQMANKASSAADRVAARAHDVRDSASDSGDSLKQRAHGLMDDVSDKAGDARERVRGAVDSGMHQARETWEDAQQSLQRAGRTAQQNIDEWRQQASDLVQREPLILAGVGLAIGAAIGALLPTTRKEGELMGDTASDLRERAKGAFDEAKTRATEMANEAVTEMKQEVDKAAGDKAAGDKASGATTFGATNSGATTAAATGGLASTTRPDSGLRTGATGASGSTPVGAASTSSTFPEAHRDEGTSSSKPTRGF